ncbi:2-phospho-L-lactate guanylyltransferase [Phaeacidiphilus oryzae]|uniref:2-phospho-L-lactate guanylyltransferase n=1 Tax=Phaeacidiphilus oryzae TaxID=348818 RepID=UPI000A001675|nr:2-phospho-L-lactate guanylyltransferase [Phaeacidiphilus oryzae]
MNPQPARPAPPPHSTGAGDSVGGIGHTVRAAKRGDGGWALVLPVKRLAVAKSRLAATWGPHRPELALAFALDAVSAALSCPEVRRVVVVTDDPRAAPELVRLGAAVVPDEPGAGLNEALAHGAREARSLGVARGVAVMSADLPALRADELGRVLRAAEAHPRAFLADAHGIGTTLLAASAAGVPLEPAFGGESRARHRRSGAVELAPAGGAASVRLDVDTAEDLAAAERLGVGPRTARVLAAARAGRRARAAAARVDRVAAMQATAFTFDAATRSGSVLLDDGTPVEFDAAAFDAGGLRLVRPGQRVRIEVAGEGDARRVTFLTLQTL